MALDDHLRGDAGVIGAGLPKDVATGHARVPDHDILQRVVEGMPHVQAAGHVRRWDDDRVRLGVGPGIAAAGEGAAPFPGRVMFFLNLAGLIGFLEHGGSALFSKGFGRKRDRRRYGALLTPANRIRQSYSRSALLIIRSISFLTSRSIK